MIIREKRITTVVSDFDGTLLKHGMQKPSEEFLTLAKRMLDQGIRFVAASGRQYPNLKRILAPIAHRIGFIAENGALVVWEGQVLHKCVIDRELGMRLIEDMKREPDSEILVSGEETGYIVPNNPEYAYVLEHVVKNVVTVLTDFEEIDDDMIKISIYYPGGVPEASRESFLKKYGDQLLVVESGGGWFDFMSRESGKGPALGVLAAHMGFSLEETVAFGDSENDISMLREVGLGFAMASAGKDVQAAACGVCESVERVLKEALEA